MSVQEIGTLHQHYVELSQRFRASWVYHQLLQSLTKVSELAPRESLGSDFQDLYAELKEVSKGLTASPATATRLETIEQRLGELTGMLVEEDNRVAPDLLRRFFHRFPKYDGKILVQLSRFYVYSALAEGWDADRLDKLDFLLTRLSQAEPESAGVAEGWRMKEVLESLWALVGEPDVEDRVSDARRRCDELRGELKGIDNLDELNERELLPLYRTFKHGLGELFVEPKIATSVLETNLAFKKLVERLYRREEQRITADYQQVFDLEEAVPVDVQLDQELSRFRQEIEQFEDLLSKDEFKLRDLAGIRRQVRSLLPRLQAARPEGSAESETAPAEAAPKDILATPAAASAVSLVDPEAAQEILGNEYRRLLEAFEASDPQGDPVTVASSSELYPFRLEPREVVAFRRLADQTAKKPVDVALEELLLRAAALRMRLNAFAAELRDSGDEPSEESQIPLLDQARRGLWLADEYLWRYEHLIHLLVLEDRGDEARRLQVLKMRLMRDYSGAWLLVYRRFLNDLEA